MSCTALISVSQMRYMAVLGEFETKAAAMSILGVGCKSCISLLLLYIMHWT